MKMRLTLKGLLEHMAIWRLNMQWAIGGLSSYVFNFGVLVLGIVAGRKNSSFYNSEQSLSLLGFAWKLWNEENIVSLIDAGICDPVHEKDILRCAHIGGRTTVCARECKRQAHYVRCKFYA